MYTMRAFGEHVLIYNGTSLPANISKRTEFANRSITNFMFANEIEKLLPVPSSQRPQASNLNTKSI